MSFLQRTFMIDLLGAEFVAGLTRDLGIEKESNESKEEILVSLGENIAQRITYEVLTRLKEEERSKAEEFLNQSDAGGLVSYLKGRIADFENFVRSVAQDELLETRKLIAA